MKTSDKIVNFCTSLLNCYRDEEDREPVQRVNEVGTVETIEDIYAMFAAVEVIFLQIADRPDDYDNFDFLADLSRICCQRYFEQEKEGGEDDA